MGWKKACTLMLALLSVTMAQARGWAQADLVDMAGLKLIVTASSGITEQHFLADGRYITKPLGTLAMTDPDSEKQGHWRLRSGMLCSTQTLPKPANESCLSLIGRKVGEEWSFLAVRGGLMRFVILPVEAGAEPVNPNS